jgi:hypothetical protein
LDENTSCKKDDIWYLGITDKYLIQNKMFGLYEELKNVRYCIFRIENFEKHIIRSRRQTGY